MNAGLLRHRVTIQARGAGVDTYGSPNGSWADVATVRAHVAPLRGAERIAAIQAQAVIDHKVIIRYRTGVTAKQRLLYGSRIFDIESVIDINEGHETIELLCKEAA